MPITPDIAEKIVRGKAYPETVRALAEKWGPIFEVEPSWIISHCFVESTNRPIPVPQRGPARGLMQLRPATATDIVRWIKRSDFAKDKRVVDVLSSSWRGQLDDLENPELNLMLGTFYIRHIKKFLEEHFGELENEQEVVAAAYNQGPGAVQKAMRSGTFVPTPPMSVYIAKIENAKDKGFA
jgi:soluble lytic murein transglycosylase-like protein